MMFASHLCTMLARILDVRLPCVINGGHLLQEIVEKEFHREIKRVNYNIVWLCWSQGVFIPPEEAQKTIGNLFQTIHATTLGRDGFSTTIHNAIKQGQPLVEYTSEDSDEELQEWEQVSQEHP
eukprot:Sdes_comp20049_c0_seq1m12908